MFRIDKDNIIVWARKYDEYYDPADRGTEERIKSILKSQRYLTQENLWDVMDWKSARIRHYAYKNSPSKIRNITRFSFDTKDERIRMESLLGQKGGLIGVGYPVGSVILHFAFPDRYPIIDFRVVRSLLGIKPLLPYKFDFWENYCATIRELSGKYGFSIRMIDKALWQFDKEISSQHGKCECEN